MANRQRHSTSSVIRKMQIIKITRYYLTSIRMSVSQKKTIKSVDEDIYKPKLPYAGGGNMKWYGHFENQCGSFLTG